MFTIFGSKQRYCDGINRRNFLKIGAFGAGLTLADLLRLRATAPRAPRAERLRARAFRAAASCESWTISENAKRLRRRSARRRQA